MRTNFDSITPSSIVSDDLESRWFGSSPGNREEAPARAPSRLARVLLAMLLSLSALAVVGTLRARAQAHGQAQDQQDQKDELPVPIAVRVPTPALPEPPAEIVAAAVTAAANVPQPPNHKPTRKITTPASPLDLIDPYSENP